MIIKIQVLSIILHLSVKKIQGELSTNTKKATETLMMRLSENTVIETKTFVKLENFAR